MRAARPYLRRTYDTSVRDSADLPEFTALGHAGSERYAGLETFPNPGVELVELESDELVATGDLLA